MFLSKTLCYKKAKKLKQVAQQLKGDNLKVAWAEFSTLSQAALLCVQLHALLQARPSLELSSFILLA